MIHYSWNIMRTMWKISLMNSMYLLLVQAALWNVSSIKVEGFCPSKAIHNIFLNLAKLIYTDILNIDFKNSTITHQLLLKKSTKKSKGSIKNPRFG